MKISEFKKKKDSVVNHIVKKYIPLTEKITRAKIITDSCYFVDGKYRPNTVLFDATMNMTILLSYTDLELSGGDISFAEDYDVLDQRNVFQRLREEIPEREYNEYIRIIEAQKHDVENEYSSPQIYIDKQIDKFGDLLKTFFENIDFEQVKDIILQQLKEINLDN